MIKIIYLFISILQITLIQCAVTVNLARVPVKYEEAPFQVSIVSKGHHICSGVLLSKKHVLTSAVCVDGLNPIEINYYTKEGASPTRYGVKHITLHPMYSQPTKISHNIAVVKLSTEIEAAVNRLPISLPNHLTRFHDRHNLKYIGWSFNNGKRGVLNSVLLKILSVTQCQGHLGNDYANHIQCGEVASVDSPGEMDLGGPVLNSENELLGITFSTIKKDNGMVFLIVNIQPLKEFITNEMGKETKFLKSV